MAGSGVYSCDDDIALVYDEDRKLGSESLKSMLCAAGILEGAVEKYMIYLEPLSGGMTNEVFRCTAVQNTENGDEGKMMHLLLRLYGSGTELLFSRSLEISYLLKLSEAGYEPRVLALFLNGRVETFISDALSLSTERFHDPRVLPLIARQMHRLHIMLPDPDGGSSSIIDRIEQWVRIAEDLPEASQYSIDFSQALAQLRAKVAGSRKSPIVFCHGDLQQNNILVNDDFSSLRIIDFEYAGHFERGFDIANYFCEWLSEFDHAKEPHILHIERFPSREQQCRFCEEYLKCGGAVVSQPDVDNLVQEVQPFILASHLQWGIWGVIQSANSGIGFDYRSYAKQRLEMFMQSVAS